MDKVQKIVKTLRVIIHPAMAGYCFGVLDINPKYWGVHTYRSCNTTPLNLCFVSYEDRKIK